MEDYEILQHLLSLEKKANTLIYDAQTEADRKVAEGEKLNRTRYEEIYSREVELLENNYKQNLSQIREKYRQQLELYKESLKTQSVDMQAFTTLAERLLIEK